MLRERGDVPIGAASCAASAACASGPERDKTTAFAAGFEDESVCIWRSSSSSVSNARPSEAVIGTALCWRLGSRTRKMADGLVFCRLR